MSERLFHSQTKMQLDSVKKRLPQSIVIHGRRGIGTKWAADYIAEGAQLLAEISPQLLTKTATIPRISVDMIRELFSLTKGKRTATGVVIINEAEAMRPEAQNAFLKLLEEPPVNVHFILTADNMEALLPTIRSRVASISMKRVERSDLETYLDYKKVTDPTHRNQLLFLASGLPEELDMLLENKKYFNEQVAYIQEARKLLGATSYDAAVIIMKQKYGRKEALRLVQYMITILEHTNTRDAFLKVKHYLEAEKNINYGANVKLQLIAAVLQ